MEAMVGPGRRWAVKVMAMLSMEVYRGVYKMS
jgi:hypothetical protein